MGWGAAAYWKVLRGGRSLNPPLVLPTELCINDFVKAKLVYKNGKIETFFIVKIISIIGRQ